MYKALFVMCFAVVGILATSASATKVTVELPMGQVQARSNERGNYYVIPLAVPSEVVGKRLDSVLLEFAVDVDRVNEEDSVIVARLGVYPLTQALGDASVRFDSTASSTRPVAVGSSRHIRMDITDTVKMLIDQPRRNHGLVIGTLTGPYVGSTTLKSSAVGPSTAVRITYLYQNRTGEPLSQQVELH